MPDLFAAKLLLTTGDVVELGDRGLTDVIPVSWDTMRTAQAMPAHLLCAVPAGSIPLQTSETAAANTETTTEAETENGSGE